MYCNEMENYKDTDNDDGTADDRTGGGGDNKGRDTDDIRTLALRLSQKRRRSLTGSVVLNATCVLFRLTACAENGGRMCRIQGVQILVDLFKLKVEEGKRDHEKRVKQQGTRKLSSSDPAQRVGETEDEDEGADELDTWAQQRKDILQNLSASFVNLSSGDECRMVIAQCGGVKAVIDAMKLYTGNRNAFILQSLCAVLVNMAVTGVKKQICLY
jgi:hypothetical protein